MVEQKAGWMAGLKAGQVVEEMAVQMVGSMVVTKALMTGGWMAGSMVV